jgi:hypothetical protein
MAGANSNIQIADLDFNLIKNNLKTFLQSQNTLKDYNYEGSALSTLLDILAYNTQYNAYYLNMVANEMFLDTALLRSSVVSHAKLLDYVPKSSLAAAATVNLNLYGVNTSTLTLPKFTNFLSEAIDGVNYNFVTTNAYTVPVANNTASFSNITIKQGIPTTLSFTVDTAANPSYTFEIPDTNVDTTSLLVTVQASNSNNTSQVFNLATSFLTLDGASQVYFLQESLTGTYQIYFGDGILGQQLINGNIVNVSYITTQGTSAGGANNFVLMDTISGYANSAITPITPATNGSAKESIDSIKFQAPKAYAAQGRAVTKEDYITAIQQNTLGYPFDAVNVWGGQENNPPVYGQVFICLKPSSGYTLTPTQKQEIINRIINPISVVTVRPTIVDPDYTYLQINANVVYDPKKTTFTAGQIQSTVSTAISNFAGSTLNTFNSTFSAPELTLAIQNANPSILTNEVSIRLQKHILPILGTSQSYQLYYNTPLKRGLFQSGITSFPTFAIQDPLNPANIINNVYFEETPSTTTGVDSISVINPGYGYQVPPTVAILGDGTGATAITNLNTNGTIKNITVTNSGNNYTSAIVTITPAQQDTTGQAGAAVAILQGQYGSLRTYYYNTLNAKTVINNNAGIIDYNNGIVTLTNFDPISIDSLSYNSQIWINATPISSIISSSYNTIVSVDPTDNTAIQVNVTAKNS